MTYYRYEHKAIANTGIRLDLKTYIEVEKTPKGKWIAPDWAFPNNCTEISKKWIKDGSKWASETKEEALRQYAIRTNNRIIILENQLMDCKSGLSQAEYDQRKQQDK